MFRVKLLLDLLRGKKFSETLVKVIKGVAEGKFGEKPKTIYWALEGYKTLIAFVLAVATFALEYAVNAGLWPEAAVAVPVLYSIAALLAAVGLYDGAVRTEPPNKE